MNKTNNESTTLSTTNLSTFVGFISTVKIFEISKIQVEWDNVVSFLLSSNHICLSNDGLNVCWIERA